MVDPGVVPIAGGGVVPAGSAAFGGGAPCAFAIEGTSVRNSDASIQRADGQRMRAKPFSRPLRAARRGVRVSRREYQLHPWGE